MSIWFLHQQTCLMHAVILYSKQISPSQFESHAGWAAKRQPWVTFKTRKFITYILTIQMSKCKLFLFHSYRNIYTSSGLTLHDIALMLANGQHLPSSASDDMCAVCGDGGELIICNGCPRVFHAGKLLDQSFLMITVMINQGRNLGPTLPFLFWVKFVGCSITLARIYISFNMPLCEP